MVTIMSLQTQISGNPDPAVDSGDIQEVLQQETLLRVGALQNAILNSASFFSIATKANLAKSDFLSSMSHELRTPLNAILGFAQLLEAGSPPPTAAQTVRLHQITKAGWYLLELINEILDLAVIESGKLSLSPEPVSLIEVMRECQVMVEPQAQKHGIQIDFLPFDNQWFATADRTRIKQILLNLLSNVIKQTRPPRISPSLPLVPTPCLAILKKDWRRDSSATSPNPSRSMTS